MKFSLFAVLFAATMLSGCAALTGHGTASMPKATFDTNDIRSVGSKYTNVSCKPKPSDKNCHAAGYINGSWLDWMQECATQPTNASCAAYRNAMISELLLVINHNYFAYEGNLMAGRSNSDFYVGTSRTALETAATLIDPAGVKTILTALATFTGATQDRFNESYYYKQTAPALGQMMQGERNKLLAEIRVMRWKPYADYTIADAVIDLDRYYR